MSKVLHLLLFKSGPKERTAHCIGLGGNRIRKLEYVFPSALKEGADILVTTGLARWAFEVVEQEEPFGVFFDYLIVPVASGGTLAGMLVGFKLADRLHPNKESRQRKVIGIDTYNKPAGVLETAILEIAERTPRLIGLDDGAVKAEDLVLDTRYNAGTHSGWSERTAEAVKLLGQTEGIDADLNHSGRAMGAILNKAKLREFQGGNHVLFLHSGGQAASGGFPAML